MNRWVVWREISRSSTKSMRMNSRKRPVHRDIPWMKRIGLVSVRCDMFEEMKKGI